MCPPIVRPISLDSSEKEIVLQLCECEERGCDEDSDAKDIFQGVVREVEWIL